jgi:hypothetical protein
MQCIQIHQNKFIDRGSFVELILTNKDNEEVARTKIDHLDLGLCLTRKWYLGSRGGKNKKAGRTYANSSKPYHVTLARFILGESEPRYVDHINGDPLDNRRSNLRYVNSSQNSFNRECRGYRFSQKMNRWVATLRKGGKEFRRVFRTELQASDWRKEMVEVHYGEFARR